MSNENPWGNFSPSPEDEAMALNVKEALNGKLDTSLEGVVLTPDVLTQPSGASLADLVTNAVLSEKRSEATEAPEVVNTEGIIPPPPPIEGENEEPGEQRENVPQPSRSSLADLVTKAVFSEKRLEATEVPEAVNTEGVIPPPPPIEGENEEPREQRENIPQPPPIEVENEEPGEQREIVPPIPAEISVDKRESEEGSKLDFVPGEKVMIPAEVLNGENKSVFGKLSESAKNIFSKAYEGVIRVTGADIAMDKMQIAFNQSWADKSEMKAIELKGQIDGLDIKSGAIETAKKALEEVIEDMKANNSPGVEKYLLKVRDLDNERDGILNKRDQVQSKLEARDAQTKLFINERDRIADKVIDRYGEILKPMEEELQNLQGLREVLEYDTVVVEVKRDEQLARAKNLESQKKKIEDSLTLICEKKGTIKKYVAGIEGELSAIASEMKKESDALAKRGAEINEKIAAADEKANPYRDKKEQFVRIKNGRPIIINMKTREKGPEFTGSEEVSSTSREESEAVSTDTESVDESAKEKEAIAPEKIPTAEKSKERQKISDFVSTWNSYLQEKGVKNDAPEILNPKEFLKISKMLPSQEMEFKNFKTIVERYYKLRKVPVDKFGAKISGFYENKIKAKK